MIDVECPVGSPVAKMVKHRDVKHEPIISIYEVQSNKIKLIVKRSEERRNQNEFKIVTPNDKTISSISKRYEKFSDRDKSLLYEDHYIRIKIEGQSQADDALDKAIILSAALILVRLKSLQFYINQSYLICRAYSQ